MCRTQSGCRLKIAMRNIATVYITLYECSRNPKVSENVLHTMTLIIISVVRLLFFMADML